MISRSPTQNISSLQSTMEFENADNNSESKKDEPGLVEYLKKHSSFSHFVLYAITYVLVGSYSTFQGPLIPYLSEHEGILELKYSILFLAKAFGFIVGSVSARYLCRMFSLHKTIMLGTGLISFFSLLFATTPSLTLKAIYTGLFSIGISILELAVLMSCMKCFTGPGSSAVFQIVYGCSGAGGLLGPFLVYVFELKTLIVMGLSLVPLIYFYHRFHSPQTRQSTRSEVRRHEPHAELPLLTLQLMCLSVLLIIGSILTYGGWISSYAVMNKFSTKEKATFYGSLFWISITAFRFIMATISGSASKKIIYFSLGGIITVCLCYFIIFYINAQFGLIIFSIGYGLFSSILFPVLLTIPSQFGYKLTMKDSSSIFICGSLGQGVVSVIVGKTMEWYGLDWLLTWLIVMNGLTMVVIWFNYRMMTSFKPEEIRMSLLDDKEHDMWSDTSIQMKDIFKLEMF